ncbi:MAG TPA: MoaD/ThiS family protein [Planctomycetota bacterium]|nr:MoaD/ThiS family protein [Planctomycetota bacterium]
MTAVLVPSPLHSYTASVARVDLSGATLGEILSALDACFPGIRFRMIDEQDRVRPHIRFFVDGAAATHLSHPVGSAREVMIVCALSGG